MIKLFQKKSKITRKDNLNKIHAMVDEISKSGNDVKIFHSKHSMLIATCIELTQGLPLEERKIVQAIVDKCRY